MAFSELFGLSASIAGGALTVALKNAYGNDPSTDDPVAVPIRSATLTDGIPDWITVTSSLSLTVPSGATLGAVANQGFRLTIYLIDAGSGNFYLGVQNVQGVYAGTLSALVSATAIDNASDNYDIIYASTDLAGKSSIVLGFLDYTTGLATPGTWDALPYAINLEPLQGPSLSSARIIRSTSSSSTGLGGYTNLVKVTLQAAGGGGGGVGTTSGTGRGGCGGAGETRTAYISACPDATISWTLGAAGSGATAGNNSGGTAADSTVTIGSITITCKGGTGGGGSTGADNGTHGSTPAGGSGGVVISPTKEPAYAAGILIGGSSVYGMGGVRIETAVGNGGAASGYGGGGGGGYDTGTTARAGGDGSPAIVFIEPQS